VPGIPQGSALGLRFLLAPPPIPLLARAQHQRHDFFDLLARRGVQALPFLVGFDFLVP
jgi:hypothetical protein